MLSLKLDDIKEETIFHKIRNRPLSMNRSGTSTGKNFIRKSEKINQMINGKIQYEHLRTEVSKESRSSGNSSYLAIGKSPYKKISKTFFKQRNNERLQKDSIDILSL